MDEELEKKFQEAYQIASTTNIKLPPDIMLQFYAYYKQATKQNNFTQPSGEIKLKNAFKLNAWIQINHLSEKESKEAYIKLVHKYLK
ncbi:acyl-CoA-binding protein [Lutibacter holmesii]|uniref:Acyl-CoA-binding protein n=1 Tax=Lutibacter holmesii TaxID=1137985 RepID=A0ABW3WMR7_9FLAO